MIASIRKWIKGCPLLGGGSVNVDMLGAEPGVAAFKYSIETSVFSPVIKMYDDGASQRQFVFDFCSRESMDEAGLKNLANTQFYEKLAEWIEEQNDSGNMPELGEDKTPLRVECMTSGFLMDTTGTTGKYQIKMRVVYYKEKTKLQFKN